MLCGTEGEPFHGNDQLVRQHAVARIDGEHNPDRVLRLPLWAIDFVNARHPLAGMSRREMLNRLERALRRWLENHEHYESGLRPGKRLPRCGGSE